MAYLRRSLPEPDEGVPYVEPARPKLILVSGPGDASARINGQESGWKTLLGEWAVPFLAWSVVAWIAIVVVSLMFSE